jgi:predicted nucleic acid-binding protein
MIGTGCGMSDRVLVDTSVWISFFRDREQKVGQKVRQLLRDGAPAYTGIIATELIRGAKSKQELDVLEELFSSIALIEMKEEYFRNAGVLGRHLMEKGLTVGTVDLLIAQIALGTDTALFSLDSHFAAIARHTALRLY